MPEHGQRESIRILAQSAAQTVLHKKRRRNGGVCWQTALWGRFLGVETQRGLDDSRAIDDSSGLPNWSEFPKNIAPRNIEVRLVEEIEEFSTELQPHRFADRNVLPQVNLE